MEKRVAVYNNNTGVIEIMSSLLAGEGLKMVAVTGRAQLHELLRAQEIQLLLLDVELDGRGVSTGQRTGTGRSFLCLKNKNTATFYPTIASM